MDSSDDILRRTVEKIIERGFAKSHVLNTKEGFGEFHWTQSGKTLRRHLLQLFDIPKTTPTSIDPDEIVAVISLILFTG